MLAVPRTGFADNNSGALKLSPSDIFASATSGATVEIALAVSIFV